MVLITNCSFSIPLSFFFYTALSFPFSHSLDLDFLFPSFRSTKSNEMSGCYSSLSWDCVTEILASLPVKSLLRFRCVSNSCNSLITSTTFIAKHFARSTQHRNQCFLLDCGLLYGENAVISMVSCHDSVADEILNLGLPAVSRSRSGSLRIVGSCNGLVCFTKIFDKCGSVNYLWNPATRDFRALPVSPFCIPPGRISNQVGHAFGSDSDCNDYKLLRMVCHTDLHTRANQSLLLDVYTWSNDSWKQIDSELQHCLDPSFSPVLYKGSFYCRGEEMGKYCIVLFHIGNEMFKKLPPVASCELDYNWKLDVLNESLATIIWDDPLGVEGCMHIWVMQDYGVGGHWTKKFRIGPFMGAFAAIGMGKNSELLILLETTVRLFSYILEKDEEVNLPSFVGVANLHNIHRYVESIVKTGLE